LITENQSSGVAILLRHVGPMSTPSGHDGRKMLAAAGGCAAAAPEVAELGRDECCREVLLPAPATLNNEANAMTVSASS
jgi:hypothetical protein